MDHDFHTKVSASIVLYHTKKLDIITILNCVEKSYIGTVYVIDNSSDDRFRFLEKQYHKYIISIIKILDTKNLIILLCKKLLMKVHNFILY